MNGLRQQDSLNLRWESLMEPHETDVIMHQVNFNIGSLGWCAAQKVHEMTRKSWGMREGNEKRRETVGHRCSEALQQFLSNFFEHDLDPFLSTTPQDSHLHKDWQRRSTKNSETNVVYLPVCHDISKDGVDDPNVTLTCTVEVSRITLLQTLLFYFENNLGRLTAAAVAGLMINTHDRQTISIQLLLTTCIYYIPDAGDLLAVKRRTSNASTCKCLIKEVDLAKSQSGVASGLEDTLKLFDELEIEE